MLRKKRPLIVWMLTLLFLLSQAGITGAAPAGQTQQTGATPFTDISSTDKNALYINYMAKRGLITGFPDGAYHPGEGLTRAQAAVLFCKIRGLNPTDKDSTFNDVVAGSHWAAGYIAAAVKAGYITGFPDSTYRPQAILTRAQGINLFLQLATEKDSSEEIPVLQDLDKNHWAANSLAIALAAGMIEAQGNNIKPEQPFARGDLARALSILLTKDPGLSQQELIGKLQVKNGTVEIKRAGSEKVQTINTASIVRKGDTITTGKDGQVEINYPDGSGILLKPDSELIIKTSIGRAYIVKDGRPGTAVEDLQVELTNGKLFGALASKYTGKEETEEEAKEIAAKNKYSKIASRDKNFDLMAAKSSAQPWYKTAEKKKVKVKVDMPWGVAAIRGSFWSNTVGSNSCGMSLLQGDGSLSSGGQTQNLSPGQSSGSGSSGGPPSPPGPMSPSESREWSQQRGWVGERAGEMNNNQGASDPGSEGQGEGEGEGEGDDPGDEPPDNLMDTLNDALDQAAQTAASAPSGSSGGGSSGGSGGSSGGGQIVMTLSPEVFYINKGGKGSATLTVSPTDANVQVANTAPSAVEVTLGTPTAAGVYPITFWCSQIGTATITITASKSGYSSAIKQVDVNVIPNLSISPNYVQLGYQEAQTLTIYDSDLGTSSGIWVQGEDLSLQVVSSNNQVVPDYLTLDSVGEESLAVSLAVGLPAGLYGFLVLKEGTPVGIAPFKVVTPAGGFAEIDMAPYIFEGSTQFSALQAADASAYYMNLSELQMPPLGAGEILNTSIWASTSQGSHFLWPQNTWLRVAAVDASQQVVAFSESEYSSEFVGQAAQSLSQLTFAPGPWVNTTVFSNVYDGSCSGYKHTISSTTGDLPFKPASGAPADEFDSSRGYRDKDDYSWIAGSAGCHIGVLGYEGNDGTVVCFTEHILQESELSGTTEAPDVTSITFAPGDSSGTTKITSINPTGVSYKLHVFNDEVLAPNHAPAALGGTYPLDYNYTLDNDIYGAKAGYPVWVFVLDSDDKIIAFTEHTMNASEINTGP